MIVSQYQDRNEDSENRVVALSWLQRQLTWEKTLERLRRAAGVLPATAVTAGAASGCTDEARSAA